MVVKKSERKASYEVLRDLVLASGGVMNIIPDILRSKSFHGWEPNQIRGLVFQIRQEYTIGEVWALYHGCIYAKEENLPPEFWRKVCDRRANRISGVANQNRIYEEKYQKIRREREAQKALKNNIKVLGETMSSSLKVIETLNDIDNPNE